MNKSYDITRIDSGFNLNQNGSSAESRLSRIYRIQSINDKMEREIPVNRFDVAECEIEI